TLRLIDRVPVAPVMAATAATAAVAPAIAHKMATDTTKPVDVEGDKTNRALTAPHPVVPLIPETTTASAINPVMTAPHPGISNSHYDEPNSVLTAPRSMIPAPATESHSTTTPHSVPKKVAVPLVAAAAVAPLVTPAPNVKPTASATTANVPAAAPIAGKTAVTNTVTSYDTKPAPVVQATPISQQHSQQQYNTLPRQHQTSSANMAPIQATTAGPLNTQPRQYQPPPTNKAPIQAATAAPLNTQPRQYQPPSTNTAPILAATAAPLVTQGRRSQERSHVDKITTTAPKDYQGPLPQLQAGEEIVWVKTVTTTDYYDDKSPPGLRSGAPTNVAHNTKNSSKNMPAPVGTGGRNVPGVQEQGVPANTVHDNTTGKKRHSGFFDRLIHRHHHENVDKGKQRT
ncbi:hypothetical protein BGZ96_001611, partial [Linnemannia gamsii]